MQQKSKINWEFTLKNVEKLIYLKYKCCDGIECAPCEQLCNKMLSCKNHKCMSFCHDGVCYPVFG